MPRKVKGGGYNFICKNAVINIFNADNAYILIYITVVSDAIVIQEISANIIDFSLHHFLPSNNFCNIRYVKIVINI